jgi:hypothetical protein
MVLESDTQRRQCLQNFKRILKAVKLVYHQLHYVKEMGSGISQLFDIIECFLLMSNKSCKYKISLICNLLKQLNLDGGAGCNWFHGWS